MTGPNPKGKVHKKSEQSIAPEIRQWDRRLRELEGLARDFQRGGMTRQEACVRAYLHSISHNGAPNAARKP